jgi:hypothetical protein
VRERGWLGDFYAEGVRGKRVRHALAVKGEGRREGGGSGGDRTHERWSRVTVGRRASTRNRGGGRSLTSGVVCHSPGRRGLI